MLNMIAEGKLAFRKHVTDAVPSTRYRSLKLANMKDGISRQIQREARLGT
jgi:hypothetical protein